MKKLFNLVLIFVMLMAFGVPMAIAAATTNVLFTATVSTFAITDAAKLTDINLAQVKIKSITIAQTAATAQNLTFYKNANSTTTITAVAVYAVPGTIGTYVVYPFNVSTTLSSVDTIDIPYFAVRSSSETTASSCKINVVYWK